MAKTTAKTKTETAKKTKTKNETSKKTSKKESFLVIVESPAKAKTIKKILGDSYEIMASYGHIRDFPKNVLGIDKDGNYAPVFEVIPDKKKVVDELSKAAKKVDKIYLAPDPDREGEAIAWHIAEVLKTSKKAFSRIVFNEITQNAIIEAVNSPREIDMDKVQAQQTRQVLDRVVGYKISPILWEKLKNYKLSAGRVQSVAVRLICEREEEIEAFTPKEYWSITAELAKQKSKVNFNAELARYKGEKIEINNEEESSKIVDELSAKGVEFKVAKVAGRETKRNPQAPFITSTLQREASSRLGYGVAKTMQVAQKLYEGIDMGASGPVGLITYMRTDSTRISDEARDAAKEYITEHYGKNYYPDTPRVYSKKGKNVQDAHEAIRPTYVDKSPESIKKHLTGEQYKVYKLIWERFIASQMESAKVKNTSVDIEAADYTFKTGTSKVMFDGFLIVYDDRNDSEKPDAIPDLEKDDKLNMKKLDPQQHFTQPPPRYTEASLVKVLEEKGIGRPSTYAPIISKVQQRNYVVKEDKSLVPTLLGKTVNEQLKKHFSKIIDYNFTAEMEQQLDDIAEHEAEWKQVIDDFYKPFVKIVDDAKNNMEKIDILSDQDCPNCGKKMAVKISRWRTQFLGCTGYPECKTMLPLGKDQQPAPEDKPSDEKCAKCGADMVFRHGPYGVYLACTSESCKHKQKIVIKTGVKCGQEGCNGEIIQKKSRYGKIFYACDQYPNCNFALWGEPTGERCPDCKSMLIKKFLKRGNKIACSSKECKYARDMKPEEE